MERLDNRIEKHSIGRKVQRYHFFYKRKGIYPFLIKNSLKLLAGMAVLLVALALLEDYLPNFEYYFELLTVKFRPLTIIAIFFLSECLFGLIPPDFFILWSKQFSNMYAMVGLLALLSYAGGVISYIIGNYIGHLPKIEAWIHKKFDEHIGKIRSWGGVLIVFAALFPLPFSPVCMAAGSVNFPVKIFLVLGLFRFIRFFAYAFVLFNVV